MAYEIGDGALMVTGSDGKSQTEKASYVVFWAKQPEGRWKVLVDVPDKAT